MGRRSSRTPGLLPLPSSQPALASERDRLERELARPLPPAARRLLAIELRRVVVAVDRLEHELGRLLAIVVPARDSAAPRRRLLTRERELSEELAERVRQVR